MSRQPFVRGAAGARPARAGRSAWPAPRTDADQAAAGGHDPRRAGAVRLVHPLADRRTDAEAAVDGDGEEAGGLAAPLRRRQVLGGGGGADERGRLAGAGDEPQQDEGGEAARAGRSRGSTRRR